MHLVIGTPMYNGQCTSDYCQSMLNLQSAADRSGVKLTTIFLGNESLIQRGRNTIAHHFMNLDATHLMFIDADIKFRTEDVVSMLKADKPIIIGPVPLKGYIDGRPVFNITPLEGVTPSREPFEIEHGGSAFMLIKREVFEALAPDAKVYTNGGTTSGEVRDYFRVEVDDRQRLLSEDYYFCDAWRKKGGGVWCAPWVKTGHRGSHLFESEYLEDKLWLQ